MFTTCETCGSTFETQRTHARNCGESCRARATRARRKRDDALRHDLIAFREGVASILARLAVADDPAVAELAAEVAAFTPDSLARRSVSE